MSIWVGVGISYTKNYGVRVGHTRNPGVGVGLLAESESELDTIIKEDEVIVAKVKWLRGKRQRWLMWVILKGRECQQIIGVRQLWRENEGGKSVSVFHGSVK